MQTTNGITSCDCQIVVPSLNVFVYVFMCACKAPETQGIPMHNERVLQQKKKKSFRLNKIDLYIIF